jgi:RimJ/RimL family protein N-acetyltransferase
MALHIRRAREADAGRLLALRRTLLSESAFLLIEPDELVATVEDERKRIVRLDAQPNCAIFVAEDDGEPVGMLGATGAAPRRQRHVTGLWLAVLKAHWGKGIASALIEHTLEWSRRSGITRVELSVQVTNLRAIDVYLRAGFRVEGVRRCSLIIDGVSVDEYTMSVVHAS